MWRNMEFVNYAHSQNVEWILQPSWISMFTLVYLEWEWICCECEWIYIYIYIYIYICIIFRCTRVMSSSTIRVLKRQNSVTTAEYKQTDGTGLHLEHLLLLRVKCFLRSHYQATAKSNGYNRRKQNNKYYRRSACRMVHGASVPLIKLCLQHVKCATKTYQIRTVFSRNVLECLQPEISSFLSFRVDTMRVP